MKTITKITITIFTLLFLSVMHLGAQSNPIFPNTQTLKKGTANEPGAVYLIENVETSSNLGVLGVDALVTIVSFSGSPTVSDIDVSQNNDNRFEPTITYDAPNESVRWRIEFIVGGTADANIEDAVLYPLDSYTLEIIDLDAGEWAEVIVPKSYELAAQNAPGTIITTSPGIVPNSIRFESDADETDQGIDPTSHRSIVKVNYENVSVVDITLGRNNNEPVTTRNISIGFLGEVVFGNPYVVEVNNPPVVIDHSTNSELNTPTNSINLLDGSSDPENNIDTSTIVLLDPNDPTNYGEPGNPLIIVGEGTYNVDINGNIIFTPENNFSGNSTINFRVRDDNLANSNKATFSVFIGVTPELEVTKTAYPSGNVKAGDTISYTILVKNTGEINARNVTVEDILPNGITYIDGTAKKTFPTNAGTNIGTYTSENLGPFNVNGRNSVTITDDTTGKIPANATLIDYSFTARGQSINGSNISEIDMKATYPSGTVYDLDFGDDLGLPNSSGTYDVSQGPKTISGSAAGLFEFIWSEDRDNRRTDNRVSSLTYTINYEYIAFPIEEQITNDANAPRYMVTVENGILLKPGETMTVTFDAIVDNGTTGNLINKAIVDAVGLPNPVSDTATVIAFDPNNTGTAMITQIYQYGSEKWIEITNIDKTNSITENLIKVQLYANKTGNQTSVLPDVTFTIDATLNPGQSVLISNSSNSITNINFNSIEIRNNELTNFFGENDIITLSTTNDTNSWANRYDMIEAIKDNTSYVRIDEVLIPNSTYAADEWVVFVDPNLNPHRVLELGGPERHPHDPLISEITNADSEANIQLGLHRIDVTRKNNSTWTNGTPDRSRYVFISEDYNHKNNTFSARRLAVNNNSKFSVTDNLLVVTNDINITNTNDEIRLIGTSQLIQTHTKTKQTFGNGKLLVEQNSIVPSTYRYNYMSSPVNTVGTSTYTLSSVLKDGTNPIDELSSISNSIAKDIHFIGGYDGSYDVNNNAPISLAEYWIYTYAAGDGNRSNWTQKGKDGIIPETDGFIFKGPGKAQNYIFVGTPKDGNLSTPLNIGGYETYLVGNPYASAINVNKFIEDNINSITGTLYFWEHQESANGEEDQSGHNFAGYIGGYATRNRAMGLAANSPENDSNDNNGTSGVGEGNYKEPKAYIAIGQGFFIGGDIDGGPIVFNNSQREYITEGDDSIFFKQNGKTKKLEKDLSENKLPIIKLGLDYKNKEESMIHRQIGISFHEANSFAYNKGFDSSIYDLGETDMYWEFDNNDDKYIIAGIEPISDDLRVPLTITIAQKQEVTLTIDEWQHINRDVYIYDSLTDIQYKVNNNKAVINLEEGLHKDRFFMTFEVSDTVGIDDPLSTINLKVSYNPNEKSILLNTINELEINRTNILDVNGTIRHSLISTPDNKNEQLLDVSKLAKGVYILRLETNSGVIAKKIIIH